MKKIIFLAIILHTLSCAKAQQLTRSQAKEQIIEKLGYPKDDLLELSMEDNSIHRFTLAQILEKYAKAGLLTISQYKGGVRASLTSEGEKYRSKKESRNSWSILVKQAELHFIEITGIRTVDHSRFGGGVNAIVEYTIEQKNITPFGIIGDPLGIVGELEEEIIEKRATFIKYDDGWRLQK